MLGARRNKLEIAISFGLSRCRVRLLGHVPFCFERPQKRKASATSDLWEPPGRQPPHMSAALILDPLGASPLRCVPWSNSKAPLGSPRDPHSFGHGLVNWPSREPILPRQARAERASEREGVEAMMRSQLHAAVSPPPSLRRALPSVTPRALRYAAAHRLACSDPLSSFLFCGATAESERIAPPLSASRFHAFPGRFRVHHRGRWVGARRADDPPGNPGSVKRLLCHGLACHFPPPAPFCLSFVCLVLLHQE